MKKLIFLLFLLFPGLVFSAPPTSTYTYTTGAKIQPDEVQTNENNIYRYLQTGVDTYSDGSITNEDISSAAGILGSKLDLSIPPAIGGTTPNTGAFSILTTTTINAFTLGGKLTAGASEIEGTNFDINGGTIDGITSLTAGGDLDIGTYEMRANTFESDVAIGTAPFTITSTTVSTNLNADLLDGESGAHYEDGLSNMVFCFGLGGGSHVADANGVIVNDSITAAYTTITTSYWAVPGNTLGTVLTTKFKKAAAISTVTVWCSIWQRQAAGAAATCKVTIGSVNGTVSGTVNRQTPEWKSFDIDVSGLVDGTTYDVTIQITTTINDFNDVGCMDSIIGIAS